MRKEQSTVMACVGAVIGAGFASGREVVVFFTQYGSAAWWLILLSALVMAVLCWLCMRAARTAGCYESWCDLLNRRRLPFLCSVLLMVLTGGAMISAAGHMAALLWNHPQAYAVGVLATLTAAMLAGYGSMRPLGTLSTVLALALLGALLGVLILPETASVALEAPRFSGWPAILGAVGYAGMNMMLAIGVVCRSAERVERPAAAAGLFGWIIGALLMISHWVYSRHPHTVNAAFPMVALLSAYGRTGYVTGVILLYMAILTTLISVLYALRSAMETVPARPALRLLLTAGLPLAVSGFGFAGIVDKLYAPAGLVCLLAVFVPIAARKTTSS